MNNPLVSAKKLRKSFGPLVAVDDFSLDIFPGETVGLVGPSGCGKTTVGRMLVKLYEPDSGTILFDKHNLANTSGTSLRKLRRKMQIIFQDPYASLNSRMTVDNIIGEGLEIHRLGCKTERRKRIFELLDLVGLRSNTASRYPHELSGGQCQRVGIARALALDPAFIVCDEPLSALDVSVQAQIVTLLKELQQELRLTYLFISHDIAMVEHLSSKVASMENGRLLSIK